MPEPAPQRCSPKVRKLEPGQLRHPIALGDARREGPASPSWLPQDWQDAQIKSILNTPEFNLRLFKRWLSLHEIAHPIGSVKVCSQNPVDFFTDLQAVRRGHPWRSHGCGSRPRFRREVVWRRKEAPSQPGKKRTSVHQDVVLGAPQSNS